MTIIKHCLNRGVRVVQTLYVLFVDHCLSFFCLGCSCCMQCFVLRFTASDFPCGIYKLFLFQFSEVYDMEVYLGYYEFKFTYVINAY